MSLNNVIENPEYKLLFLKAIKLGIMYGQSNKSNFYKEKIDTEINSIIFTKNNDETPVKEEYTQQTDNSNKNDPFHNSWLEHKFKLKMQEKSNQGFTQPTYLEQQFEKIANPGFDYVSYVDNTNLLQNKNSFVPNKKIYDTLDPAYVYQNPNAPSGFYEDVALKSNKADTNLQFIKKIN